MSLCLRRWNTTLLLLLLSLLAIDRVPTACPNCRPGTSQHCCWVFLSSGIFLFIISHCIVFCVTLYSTFWPLATFAPSQSVCVFCLCSVAVSLACYYRPPAFITCFFCLLSANNFNSFHLLSAVSCIFSVLRQFLTIFHWPIECLSAFCFLFLSARCQSGAIFQFLHSPSSWCLFSSLPLLCLSTSTCNVDQRSVKRGTSTFTWWWCVACTTRTQTETDRVHQHKLS